MEEKKLTDEEIVQAFETCKNGRMLCQECPCFIKDVHCICSSENDIDTVLDLIHRLQNDYSNLKEKYVKVLDLNEKVIAEQQAEIERLTEENSKLRIEIVSTLNEKAELQKQVDELKTENKELYKEHTTLIAGSILKQQDIVKDTAKKIIADMFKEIEGYERIDRVLERIAERYGVEVE